MAPDLRAPLLPLLLLAGCTPEPAVEIGCLYECVPEPTLPAGDSTEGRRALLNEGYISCGFPAKVLDTFPDIFSGEPLPERAAPNTDIPYYLTIAPAPSGTPIVNANCLTCHAGYIDGELVVGLGDHTGDATRTNIGYISAARLALGDDADPADLAELDRFEPAVRAMDAYLTDTVGMNRGDALIAVFAAHRDPATLAWADPPVMPLPPAPPVPHDVPPWWGMKKKNAMFANTAVRGDFSNFVLNEALMCMESPEEAEAMFAYAADVRAYIESIEAPEWPAAIDADLAAEGEDVFVSTCAQCHGTYGDAWVYPNVVVPIDAVGTDPVLADEVHLWEAAWDGVLADGVFGPGVDWGPQAGYIAPPLDGIWASAPYFHNGAVPTLAAVLDSTLRPDIWRRSSYDSTDYDWVDVGWTYEELSVSKADTPEAERKYVYDTSGWGYQNGGHTFGDALSAEKRTALVEYLKTL
ncbi:MAG: hypothetical protein Q8P41_26790 [Pseudomonadota bacterium]|nr:hypothetical protein [Pseudomonadota bacterium]